MKNYIKSYSYKGKYKIKESSNGHGFDVFNMELNSYEPDFEELPTLEEAKEYIKNSIAMDEAKKKHDRLMVEQYAKKFKMLSEYSFWGMNEEEPDDANAGGAPPPGPDTGGDPNAGGGAPPPGPDAGGDPNAGGGAPPPGPDAGGDPNAMPPEGGDPNADPNAGGDPNAMPPDDGGGEFEDIDIDDAGGDQLQPDDNVIDVSALTGSQEQTNSDLEQLTDKFGQLIQLNDKVTKTLEMLAKSAEESKAEIQAVKDDIAKRIPTEIEKLKGRKSASEPYNQSVADYWNTRSGDRPGGEKYDVLKDETTHEGEEYVLRNSDIENINPQSVYNSFNNSLKGLVGW